MKIFDETRMSMGKALLVSLLAGYYAILIGSIIGTVLYSGKEYSYVLRAIYAFAICMASYLL